jgi:hypothetical protein
MHIGKVALMIEEVQVEQISTLVSVWGEIMNMSVYFACFMRNKTIFSQYFQLPAYKSIFLFRISLYSKNKTCE